MPQHLPQHHARIQADLLVLVPRHRSEKHLFLAADVFHRRPSRPDLSSEEVVEDLDGVLACLEVEAGDVSDEEVEEVCRVSFLCELGEQFGDGVYW